MKGKFKGNPVMTLPGYWEYPAACQHVRTDSDKQPGT
jgi:hypothetical protein